MNLVFYHGPDIYNSCKLYAGIRTILALTAITKFIFTFAPARLLSASWESLFYKLPRTAFCHLLKITPRILLLGIDDQIENQGRRGRRSKFTAVQYLIVLRRVTARKAYAADYACKGILLQREAYRCNIFKASSPMRMTMHFQTVSSDYIITETGSKTLKPYVCDVRQG